MAGDVTTRPLEAGDFDAWYPLWQAYCAFYNTVLTEDVSRHTFERMADPDYEQMFGFLAIDGTSGAVGMVTGVFQPSTFVKEPICYLEDLFTHADARGKGVGRALISAVGEHAKQTGCPKVYWHTAENNYAGRTLYDKVAKQTHIKYEQKFKA